MSRKHVQETHDHVQQSLLTYCINCYPHVQVSVYYTFRDFILYFDENEREMS